MIKIREASIDDAKALIPLLDSLGYENTEKFIKKRISQLLSNSNDALVVACDNEKIVGFISFCFMVQLGLENDFCRITYFCVLEEYRSKKVGAMLESYVEDEAKKRNCNRIEVHCNERRKEAHRFYYRQNYIESPKYLMKML
ncbi:GNAT family N-acetyltransferase [Halarcobacter ebronensis]|uniref:GNAT family N-acetyltransferase n=1 Tax=Halarcobacter ebronensis TaxID=1462615 RepID=A0A4Q1AQB8_9BACT|nr:GNAT family N-acetyltransferase [Halarcobacter ebronensis]QKF81735.1 acetyltransferase (GNAT family) [Halarcobacter ebronensis]RXK04587.1 GNAT family N-acetyltransferase [Halarcobacter ebronensis]